MAGCRLACEALKHDCSFHIGLWLQRFLIDKDDSGKASLVQEVCKTYEPPSYKNFFERWKQGLQTLPGIQLFVAKSPKYQEKPSAEFQRLVVGMGAESVLENSITLHHVYGVPYLPGSALKGVAAKFALYHLEGDAWGQLVTENNQTQRKPGAFHQELFGNATQQGIVTFLDALPFPHNDTPADGPKWKLHPDVMTPHHSGYYGGGQQPPADWDSPIPAPFISASGTFLVALSGPKEWVDITLQILRLALQKEGIGAKTSSGYGRLEIT